MIVVVTDWWVTGGFRWGIDRRLRGKRVVIWLVFVVGLHAGKMNKTLAISLYLISTGNRWLPFQLTFLSLSGLHSQKCCHHQQHASLSYHVPTWLIYQPRTCGVPSRPCHTPQSWNSDGEGTQSCSRTWEGCREESYCMKIWYWSSWMHQIDREVGHWWSRSREFLVMTDCFEM